MTIEQYLKAQLGELQFALAVTMAERDSLKAHLGAVTAEHDALKPQVEEAAAKPPAE